MNYVKILKADVGNGKGVGVTLFCSGCIHKCPGCFNPETHSFSAGELFTEEAEQQILELCKPDYINHLALLGGDPMHPNNWPTIKALAKKFKMRYPNKTVWLWTGYLWEDIVSDLVDSDIDILVDGKFVEELKDLKLKYCGSSNQRVIDVQASLKNNSLTLYN